MARRRTGWRWLSTVVFVTLITGAPCPAQSQSQSQSQPQPRPQAALPEKINNDKSIQMSKIPAPEIAVLDYLGRYAEAGDGIDPLGLADGEMAAGTNAEPTREPGERR